MTVFAKGGFEVDDKANERQLSIIFLVIIGAFSLFILTTAYLSTGLLQNYQEAETKMVSVELSYILDDVACKSWSGNRDMNVIKIFNEHTSDGKYKGISLWITDASGHILAQADNNKSEFPSAYLEDEDGTSAMSMRTSGTRLFLADREICVSHGFFNGAYRLIVLNDGAQERYIQRTQYAVIFFMCMILVIVLIVLISNIISRYNEKLIRLATMDELTGLANRKSFTADFNTKRETAENGTSEQSLFLLDIDFFKQINDSKGHASGDAALVLLADHIKEYVAKNRGMAGRWGGDEFIGTVSLPVDEAYSSLLDMCSKIREDSQRDVCSFTVSVGVTPVYRAMTLYELCENADKALYESKHHGRNTVTVFEKPQNEEVTEESEDVNAVIGADSLKAGERTAADVHEISHPCMDQERDSLISILKEHFLSSIVFAVKWMTPFVAGGGILIALAFLFDAASIDLSTLSVDERSDLGSITSIATYIKLLGDTTFSFMLPVFSAFMAYKIAGESAFMAGFVGGYMVINTNSGFIGATLAGLAAGVVSREINLFINRLPGIFRGVAPVIIYPVFSLTIVQAISLFMIMPLTNLLGSVFDTILSFAKSQGINVVCTVAAGMMSVDMGGIINKIAYNYGIMSLETKENIIMAAVMAGGMVPPIGIAISAFIFRNRFSKEDRHGGLVALFMGLSFITEGAIPYVITDFVRIIPSCIAGSALAGFLTAVFGCTLPAPHGGIFVLPVVGHPFRYMAAVAAGSLLTALLLGILKRPVREETSE